MLSRSWITNINLQLTRDDLCFPFFIISAIIHQSIIVEDRHSRSISCVKLRRDWQGAGTLAVNVYIIGGQADLQSQVWRQARLHVKLGPPCVFIFSTLVNSNTEFYYSSPELITPHNVSQNVEKRLNINSTSNFRRWFDVDSKSRCRSSTSNQYRNFKDFYWTSKKRRTALTNWRSSESPRSFSIYFSHTLILTLTTKPQWKRTRNRLNPTLTVQSSSRG